MNLAEPLNRVWSIEQRKTRRFNVVLCLRESFRTPVCLVNSLRLSEAPSWLLLWFQRGIREEFTLRVGGWLITHSSRLRNCVGLSPQQTVVLKRARLWVTEKTFTPSPVEGCGPTGSAGLKMFFCAGTAVGSSDEGLMAPQLRVESIAASPWRMRRSQAGNLLLLKY